MYSITLHKVEKTFQKILRKISESFLYVVAKQQRSPFILTIFLSDKFKILISQFLSEIVWSLGISKMPCKA